MPTESQYQRLLWDRLASLRARWPMEREFPISGYSIDIYIPSLRLAIEVDGLHHSLTAAQRRRDRLRDAALQRRGIMTVRVRNNEILGDVKSLLHELERVCERRESTPLAERGQRLPGPPLMV